MSALPIQCATPGCPRRAEGAGPRCKVHGGNWTGTRPMGPGWSRLRAQVLAEEPYCWCGERSVTVDHRLARARGGDDSRANLRPLCSRHAREKDLADRVTGQKLARRARGGGR